MLLYAVTIFVSAFLLFQVQPIIAKIILPWFGGSAAVWTTCMLFFQTALLGGYLYSHWTTGKLSPRVQTWLHLALLGLSLLVLPVAPSDNWKPAGSENPTIRILALLTATVGFPYLLLSTTGPLVQAWFARAFPGVSPYRLFALSNTASVLALLSYPILVEPVVGTHRQALMWSITYALFAGLCAACAWRSRSLAVIAGETSSADLTANPPGPRLFLLWGGLAACASTLLLSVTNHLTQDVAPIPFLWVLPLSLYLLSFILTFDSAGWYKRWLYLPLTGAALGAMAYASGADRELAVFTRVALFAAALFLCCMTCHGEVATLKPHPRYLTSFYLTISIGGALGGLFVGVIAPYFFTIFLEMPIAILACALLVLMVHRGDPESPLNRSKGGWAWVAAAAATLAIGVVLVRDLQSTNKEFRVIVRNFYGGLKTADWGTPDDSDWSRKLTHGVINHGEQWLQEERRREPTTYFGPGSGVGRAIRSKDRDKPQRIGITGLGAGVMLSYARPGDYYRIYEINPQVVALAQREFTFLKDCPAKVDVVLGDARLSLEREERQNFDLLHMDAFSSDSVPAHLLTREAFQLYFRHLKPDGVLVIHISNKYLDLEPVVARAAEALGKPSVFVNDEGDQDGGYFGTDMVVISNRKEFLNLEPFKSWKPPRTLPGVLLWTDDYSNLFRIVK